MTAAKQSCRPALLAGTWYPKSPDRLAGDLARYREAALPVDLEGRPIAVIAPHAGYAYSGPCAGQAYRALEGMAPERVVLIAPSHQDSFSGVALSDAGGFETPLGVMPLDQDAIALLARREPFQVRPRAHAGEHAVEIQLPFVQRVAGAVPIVPLVVGRLDEAGRRLAAAGLRAVLDARSLLVVSSDFTHYGASFGYQPFAPAGDVRGGLEQLDGRALERIVQRDIDGFRRHCERERATICGALPIEIAMRALEGRDLRVRALRYETSGDHTGDWSHCVAYAAVLFEDLLAIGPEAGRLLCRAARQAILRAVRRTGPGPEPEGTWPACLGRRAGAFVTLTRQGELRGCVGQLRADRPLIEVVASAAVSAATGDPRFPPVGPGEVGALEIEVSVLSEPVEILDEREIVLGRDGLIAEAGPARGTLLPQVAVEHGLDCDAFVQATLRKAGIPVSRGRDGVRLWRYGAQVIRAD